MVSHPQVVLVYPSPGCLWEISFFLCQPIKFICRPFSTTLTATQHRPHASNNTHKHACPASVQHRIFWYSWKYFNSLDFPTRLYFHFFLFVLGWTPYTRPSRLFLSRLVWLCGGSAHFLAFRQPYSDTCRRLTTGTSPRFRQRKISVKQTLTGPMAIDVPDLEDEQRRELQQVETGVEKGEEETSILSEFYFLQALFY